MMADPRQPREFSLSTLLEGICPIEAAAERLVTGLSLDSRRLRPGDLFLACQGQTVNGAEFIDKAIERGAMAVLWEPDKGVDVIRLSYRQAGRIRPVPVIAVDNLSALTGHLAHRFYGRPSSALFVTGITGTNGKTSCSFFLAQCLAEDAPGGIIGTLGHGIYPQLQAGTHTTPDAVTVHRWLAELRDQGATSVSMEVSSHALDQGRINGVEVDCAVFTNLSRDHLDYHGNMQRYAEAKRNLFLSEGLHHAVINIDDHAGRNLIAHLPDGVKHLSYGLVADNLPDILAHNLRHTGHGIEFEVITPQGRGQLTTGLLGDFNVSNLLAVLGVLLQRGVALDAALARLSRVRTVPGRMETFGGGAQPLVIVDYAHTPDALEQALAALREHCRGRLWCVFGCGGDRDTGKRPLMGAIAEQRADRVVLTSDNPRSEDLLHIIDAIRAGMIRPDEAVVVPDRHNAIETAIRHARPGDVVLVAGKGHENWQQTGAERKPFSDSAEVQACLQVWQP